MFPKETTAKATRPKIPSKQTLKRLEIVKNDSKMALENKKKNKQTQNAQIRTALSYKAQSLSLPSYL